MNTRLTLSFTYFARRILIVLILSVLVFGATIAYVQAQTGGEPDTLQNALESEIMIDPVPGGPGFIMINPFAFRPYYTTTPWGYYGIDLYNPSLTDASNMRAALTLPHGATITKVTLYYIDGSSKDLTLFLVRVSGNLNMKYLANVITSGNVPDERVISVEPSAFNIVDNQSFSYYLGANFPASNSVAANLLLINVRIDYAYTVYTPTIMR